MVHEMELELFSRILSRIDVIISDADNCISPKSNAVVHSSAFMECDTRLTL